MVRGSQNSALIFMMKRFNYFLVAIVIVCWAGVALSANVSDFSGWFVAGYFGLSAISFFFFLQTLFRKSWRQAVIYSLPIVLLILSVLGVSEPTIDWLRTVGFRIHIAPVDKYRSNCKLVAFLEGSKQQQVGECESIATSSTTRIAIIYDTTGELILPRGQRTQEWKRAISSLSAGRRLAEFEDRRSRIFGMFYAVDIGLEDEEG
jgi:hypothetical protein